MTARYPFEVPARRRPRTTIMSVGKWAFLAACLVITGGLILVQLAGGRIP